MSENRSQLRVATWNLNGNNRADALPAVAYLNGTLRADVGLVQEAVQPGSRQWPGLAPVPVHGSKKWGTGIIARELALEPLTDVWSVYNRTAASPMTGPYQGSVVAGVADLPPVGNVVFVSIYARVDNGYSFMHVHAILNTLIPLLDSNLGRHVVVGGDINNGTQLRARDRHFSRHRNLLDRFAASGLYDLWDHAFKNREPLAGCPCGAGPACRHVRTQRHQNRPNSKPWQTDYLWATAALRDRLVTCEPVDNEASWALSDHCPVLAEFDLA